MRHHLFRASVQMEIEASLGGENDHRADRMRVGCHGTFILTRYSDEPSCPNLTPHPSSAYRDFKTSTWRYIPRSATSTSSGGLHKKRKGTTSSVWPSQCCAVAGPTDRPTDRLEAYLHYTQGRSPIRPINRLDKNRRRRLRRCRSHRMLLL